MKKIFKHSFPEVAKSVTQTNDMKQCRCMTSSLLLTAFCHLEPNVAQTKHRITIMAHWPWLALWWLGIDRNSYWLKFLCISFAPSICSHVQKLQTLLLFSWRFRSVSLSRSSLSVHRWVQKIGTALLDIQQVQKKINCKITAFEKHVTNRCKQLHQQTECTRMDCRPRRTSAAAVCSFGSVSLLPRWQDANDMSWTCIHADRSAQIVNMWNGLKTLKLTETNNTKQKNKNSARARTAVGLSPRLLWNALTSSAAVHSIHAASSNMVVWKCCKCTLFELE